MSHDPTIRANYRGNKYDVPASWCDPEPRLTRFEVVWGSIALLTIAASLGYLMAVVAL